MYDTIKITKMIKDMGENFNRLESFGLNEHTIQQNEKAYAASMAMFVIISRMINLVEARNKIAHEYFNIRRKELLSIKNQLYAVKTLIEKIKKLVAREVGKNAA